MGEKRRCAACGCDVAVMDGEHARQGVQPDPGKLCTHGPGPNGEFICPGSGDKSMVEAAKHLNVGDCGQ